jgi:hypothetical protein
VAPLRFSVTIDDSTTGPVFDPGLGGTAVYFNGGTLQIWRMDTNQLIFQGASSGATLLAEGYPSPALGNTFRIWDTTDPAISAWNQGGGQTNWAYLVSSALPTVGEVNAATEVGGEGALYQILLASGDLINRDPLPDQVRATDISASMGTPTESIPEPSTLVMVTLGMVGVLGARRRR